MAVSNDIISNIIQNMFRNPFKDFFYFTKADRRAVFAVGCIAVFCSGVACVVYSLEGDEAADADGDFVVEDGRLQQRRKWDGKNADGRDVAVARPSFHAFDPNEVDSLTLVSFGIRAYKVKNFLRYRAAGKVFLSAEDMGDTYGWTGDDVALVAPYVRIDKARWSGKRGRRVYGGESGNRWHGYGGMARLGVTEDRGAYRRGGSGGDGRMNGADEGGNVISNGGGGTKFDRLTVVDVNVADSATLRKIPGVGEKTCRAIIRYRERLGGLHDVRQLLEVSIVSSDLLRWFEVKDGCELRKLRINRDSFRVLNAHPYISYDQVKDLLNYIRLYGPIVDERALRATGIFSENEMEKLGPYIDYGR